jgi:outer membrane biogenesis lipoprotein LolB
MRCCGKYMLDLQLCASSASCTCWMSLQEKQKLTAEQQHLLKQIMNYSYEVRLSYIADALSCAA